MKVPYGWIMWDKTDPNGFDDRFFVFGDKRPIDSEEDQAKKGGDHQGHIWDCFPLYR